MSVPETEIIDEWLYELLTGDATLQALESGGIPVYNEEVPIPIELPVIIFQNQSSVSVQGVGGARIFNSSLYVVRGVAPGASFKRLKLIASRIDALLHRSTGGTTSDGIVQDSVQEEIYRVREQDRGIAYRHLGGIYRIWASANN